MLASEQIAHFNAFGLLVLRRLFTRGEMAEIGRQFDGVMEEDKAGREPPAGRCSHCTGACLDRMHSVYGLVERPPLHWLAEDDRTYLPLTELLGPGIAWMGSEGQRYHTDSKWHPDGWLPNMKRIKVAVYLDPLAKETGCLRVIPGSHRDPAHGALEPLRDAESSPFGVGQADVPSHAIETQPGDVVFFDMNIWHASFGGAKGRRQIAMVVTESIENADHEDFLRNAHEVTVDIMKGHQYDFRDGRIHEDSFLHSERPRIKAMVSKLVELGYR